MVIDESSRHALYTRLQEILGNDEARTLMQHLPPVGWADVATKQDVASLRAATKHDLVELEARLDLRFESLHHELSSELHSALNQQTRTFVTWLIAGMAASSVTVGGIAIGAARFT